MAVQIEDLGYGPDADEERELIERALREQAEEEADEEIPEVHLDPAMANFVDELIKRVMLFCEELWGNEFYPYQKEVSYRIIESLVLQDAEEITAIQSRQSGKALALTTNIPTPDGWVKFGDLCPGDYVFGPQGAPVPVQAVTPVWEDRPCYRVEFNDGTSIVADANHEWVMAGEDSAITTEQLRGRVERGKGHKIDLPLPISGPDVDLPVDPYVLGAWLGDGGSRDGRFTCADPEIVERIEGHFSVEKKSSYGPYGHYIKGLTTAAQGLDVFPKQSVRHENYYGYDETRKHIPMSYLRASYRQREALLQGLMDTDGYISSKGRLEFCVMNERLAQDFVELLRSLGIKAKLTSGDAILNGKAVGTRYRVHFSAFSQHGPVPFHLARKRDRLRPAPVGTKRSQAHYVTAVVPVESVPVRCIQVEGGLFVAGDGWVVTHNSEVVATTLAGCMVLFPLLAKTYPIMERFKDGLWVGLFAPVEEQSALVFDRMITRLTSERAKAILNDPEIDQKVDPKSRIIKLTNGSLCRRQTANPRAKIEGTTYHIALIDEAQDTDEGVVRKSIHPMLASTAGTKVKIGTPGYHKGDFYKAIQTNKRRARGKRKNHFEYNWRVVGKYNPAYKRYVEHEMITLGEDSEEFQMAYNLRWMLDRGMLITDDALDHLADKTMPLQKHWHKSPCVVGIDPARVTDSTVVTVCWVDWDYPDPAGYREHRILNWLEITGTDWEEQYFEIMDFLEPYWVSHIAVDGQGMGDPVAQRLQRLMGSRCEVTAQPSDSKNQSERWKHMISLLQRDMIIYPGHSKARRTRVWRRFRQQMSEAEKQMKGQYLLVEAPNERDAHDDFVDSLALATFCSQFETIPVVEEFDSPFAAR